MISESENIISLAFSPCPNDTFIFDALVNNKIDTEGLKFSYELLDIENLNNEAINNKYDITKLSFNAFLYVKDYYELIKSGAALGNNCGPILISNKNYSLSDVKNLKIGLPGKHTTAAFLFNYAFPKSKNIEYYIFSEIEKAILSNEIDAGVIIHESRFTFEQKGLIKLIDLGEYWEKTTNMPIPLGGIFVKKSLSIELKKKINNLICESILFAIDNPDSSKEFVKKHARELSDNVINQHINLYVNKFSIDLGVEGMKAIERFIEIAENINKVK